LGYTLTFVAEALTLACTVEILQRAHWALWSKQPNPRGLSFPRTSLDGELGAAEVLPDLHRMGELFLPGRLLRWVYWAAVMLHFLSILVSYALTGSKAYLILFTRADGFDAPAVLLFVGALALLLLAAYAAIHSLIGILTLAKVR
jgi:hypothetical protein